MAAGVLTACEQDPTAAARFFRVSGLIDPPARLFSPSFVYRVARANLASRQQDSR